MTDDIRIRLHHSYTVRESTAKRDHADDALTSSPVRREGQRNRQRPRDSFEMSSDAQEDARGQKEAAKPAQAAEEKPAQTGDRDDAASGGVLDVQA